MANYLKVKKRQQVNALLELGWSHADDIPADRRLQLRPHWLRTRIVDPETLSDAEEGVLVHVDLANAHSVLAVMTADTGRRQGDDFVLTGRLRGSAARGCSIAMDEWLR